MRANYGYADGSGEFYLTIDTDKCDGCGECAEACPQGVLEVAEDDWDDLKARVKPELQRKLADVCRGFHGRCKNEVDSCHAACPNNAITHSW